MSNPAILRPQVHRLSEECSGDQQGFQSTATRLVKHQRRLSRFIEQSFVGIEVDPQVRFVSAQVAVYMLSVSLRVFEQVGGRMRKATTDDINAATARIQSVTDSLLPADAGFAFRARQIDWRTQPHLLDEILWALFNRSAEQKEEIDLPPDIAAMVYMILWACVEALDKNWTPSKDWIPAAGLLDGEDADWSPPSP
jgi:hypothetical protein